MRFGAQAFIPQPPARVLAPVIKLLKKVPQYNARSGFTPSGLAI